MSAHTPGPWKLLPAPSEKASYGAAPHLLVATETPRGRVTICDAGSVVVGSGPESLANARLIAAAPELLAACVAQQRTIDALVEIIEDVRRTLAVDGAARWAQEAVARIDSGGACLPEHHGAAAIAKARGA